MIYDQTIHDLSQNDIKFAKEFNKMHSKVQRYDKNNAVAFIIPLRNENVMIL